jgi:hypothetical protein
MNLSEKSIIGDKLISDDDISDYKVITNEETIVLLIFKDELYNLMSKHIELVQDMITVINKSYEPGTTETEELIESVFI